MRPAFSRLRGAFRIGAAFFDRAGARLASPAPSGLVDALDAYTHPGIDVACVHPSIAPFFLDPASLALRIRSRWRFPFSWLWFLARPWMALIGQLVLPLARAEIDVEMVALDPRVDGRADVRGVLRRYAHGAIMQVVAYATHARERPDGTWRYMHATFPIPLGHLAGVLRLDPIATHEDGSIAVELTSTPKDGDDAAIWIVHPLGSFRAPLGERLRLWPAGSPFAPPDLDAEAVRGASVVGRHEQSLLGVLVVTHDYGFAPRAPGSI